MSPLTAVMLREGRIRATNAMFIFWDLVYPLGYLLVFGVGMNQALTFPAESMPGGYHAFFLAGVLGMASFGIASNTAWSFFMDRDNGIFYEMLTYPLTRAEYLIGKVVFNVLVALAQAAVTVVLAAALLDVPVRWDLMPLAAAAMIVGTAGWFFFYAIFAVTMRRNDAFNSLTSIFYFVFLFASSMFYPLDPLPAVFRTAAYLNPITWQVDVLRYATTGLGDTALLTAEAAGFILFTLASFAGALVALRKEP
jgi:ABC-2 type transport system permease protein